MTGSLFSNRFEGRDEYRDLAAVVGDAMLSWTAIEDVVHDIVLHASETFAPIPADESFWLLHGTLSHMELRQKIGMAKLLIFELEKILPTEISHRTKGLSLKAEKLLNFIDNDARAERNRWVHDHWLFRTDGQIFRSQLKPGIVNVQSRIRESRLWNVVEFEGLDHMCCFLELLDALYEDLVTLDNHFAWLNGQLENPSSFDQPLPTEWKFTTKAGWRPHASSQERSDG